MAKLKVKKTEKRKYTLKLNEQEASMLCTILGRFESGGPTSPLWSLLRTNGVKGSGWIEGDASTLFFKQNEKW